jgi:hypothetical protein
MKSDGIKWIIIFTYVFPYNVTCDLIARIVEPTEPDAARERPCKRQVTARYHGERGKATIVELWGEVSSELSAMRLYNDI